MELSSLVQQIQYMLAPGIMISSSALLLLGYQTKFSNLFNRFRALNQEKRLLAQKSKREVGEDERLENLKEQLVRLFKRAGYVKNAIVLTYAAIISFIATSVFLFVNNYTDSEFIYLTLSCFLLGLTLVLLGSLLMLAEVSLSFHILQLERKS
ncbi:MAG: DUF2721 domain-containing protein [Candidatus Omnitrophica bacterium]|nr:DUF2721 domain-containing protein [Candidatus Omnitrophota bacterium]